MRCKTRSADALIKELLTVGERSSISSSCGSPLSNMAADGPQVVRQETQTDPPFHAIGPMIATALQPEPTPQHANPSLDPRAEAMASPEPALPLVTRTLSAPSREGDAPHASGPCLLL